uniref:NADH dehydrogenase subunit 9 n=1 Tax=Cryptocaryon irritans TaxID=153251 RepID=UPI0022FD91A4|nr:NADH dehydrogenase subunit 9 [Cryptocaryon irritans]WBP62336.1 NADH dehydrogenase subunit 9 [Cryptocaryon irritans]
MYKKYEFPLNIFIILEKDDLKFFTSEKLTPNHYICLIKPNSIFLLNQILKNEFSLTGSMLIELSSIDSLKYNKIIEDLTILFKKNRNLIFYIYYFFSIKTKLTFITYQNKKNIFSIDSIYKNAGWLEREVSEMFNINFSFKKDLRKLLLDYSKDEYPMLKDFNSEGLSDVFYNFFEENVSYLNNDNVEL